MLTALRWMLVPVCAAFGCWLGIALGVALGSLSHSLCPADQLVSGFCHASWISTAEAFSMYAGAAVGAAIAVLLPYAVAPRHKRIAAACAFLLGAAYALKWASVFPKDWQYPACAIIAGLAALAWAWRAGHDGSAVAPDLRDPRRAFQPVRRGDFLSRPPWFLLMKAHLYFHLYLERMTLASRRATATDIPTVRAIDIRPASHADLDAMWAIFQPLLAAGDAFPFGPGFEKSTFQLHWFSSHAAYVAESGGELVGMYKMGANYPDHGAHVASATYAVAKHTQGRGIGRALVEHSLARAREEGFLAMQFNYVVSANEAAMALYRKLGFNIAGTLPQAFRHPELGLVDAYVLHRFLDDQSTAARAD